MKFQKTVKNKNKKCSESSHLRRFGVFSLKYYRKRRRKQKQSKNKIQEPLGGATIQYNVKDKEQCVLSLWSLYCWFNCNTSWDIHGALALELVHVLLCSFVLILINIFLLDQTRSRLMHLFSWRGRWSDQTQVLGCRNSWSSGSPSCS